MLFRGYLLRGLANRFTSPVIWALLPALLFTSLHWSASSSPAINACVLASIAAFALLLTLVVYATGNLGAAFGAHLGNNLTGFLLISHQDSYIRVRRSSSPPSFRTGRARRDCRPGNDAIRPCLDSASDFLSTRPEFRDEYPSEQADQDAETSLR
ncbi:CPBP family intramembrane glutamic endopeptidase [Mesorhizobium sp. M7A.F.Ca.ET.027.03.2.1]|uniref:CPBP family intramembrane glutamic endopeptidase n=1 Tax=Mesorhizobium sp. M7A.F.Ca.ET.027.03.2.1 TaxID=2496656 RepID=UPI001FE14D9F|nr:CPBP family intramembrane glutamic endopeptidase [Mesorhizobium sp. M7A.F.Ca.ET.027.03.2.1]